MTYQAGEAIKNPHARLSFDIFSKMIRDNMANIKAMLDIVLYAYELFNGGEKIWPEQFDQIISALNMMQEPVDNMSNTIDHIPENINSLRYPLVGALHEVSRCISDLTMLITLFRVDCQHSSNQVNYQRWEIRRKFELLIQSYEDIMQEVPALLDKARFQVRLLEI